MKEGFYSLIYTGSGGDFGMAVLVFDTSQVVGADVAGGRYDGTYEYNSRTDQIDARVTATIPAGIPLVTGIPAQTQEWSFPINASFPRETTNTPIQIDTPYGPVNVAVKFLRGFPN